mmetsp:Transcript_133526/g.285539  ORF Transcript_133526/g.285539 Transcript_133526/m.285539 type:complete len:345 (+) Transcript_133526:103-1137(+)
MPEDGERHLAGVFEDDVPELPAEGCERSNLSKSSDFFSAATFFTVKPSEIHLQSLIGEGAQADVYKAEWTRVFPASKSSITVAVKRLKTALDTAYRDREALACVTDHPNLVKCFDSTLDPPFLIVTEFCAGGSLFDFLYNTRQALSFRQKVKILTDVASGMQYLHTQRPKILHRDLKSSNVLLMKAIRSTAQEPYAKVADFGLARTSTVHLTPSSETEACDKFSAMTVGVGTWRWMAPEVFEIDNNGSYDERADVYSFAMLMYEVFARKMPYSDRFPTETSDPRIGLHISLGLRPNIVELSDKVQYHQLLDLMQRSWANDAKSRPDFEELELELRVLLDGMADV